MPAGNPNWKKGVSACPTGRPKGAKNKFGLDAFKEALALVEKNEKKSLYVHIVEQAFKSERVLIALISRIVPAVEIIKEEDKELLDSAIEFSGVNKVRTEQFTQYLN